MNKSTPESGIVAVVALILAVIVTTSPALGQNPGSTSSGPTEIQKVIEDLAAARGHRIYMRACSACHGRSGNGQGPTTRGMNPRPRDFTAGIFKFRSTPTGELPTDDDLYRTISNGIPGSMMPPWSDLLSDSERRDVVAYIKRFNDDFSTYGQGSAIEIPEEPEVTHSRTEEGRFVYMIMECSSCHGARGRGDGSSAAALTDDWGYRIRPFDFTRESYRAGSDGRSIYNTFTTGLDGTPMPSYENAFLFGSDSITDFTGFKESYSESEIQELKEYLASQPSSTQLAEESSSNVIALVTQRKWSLVHFVQSLASKPGLFHLLFQHDYEVTQ